MKDHSNYTEKNALVIDRWVDEGWEWGRPVSHEICEKARSGEWDVLLTPTKPVPKDWFPPLEGVSLLGLACGGAQQMPIFALLGAKCNVLDYSVRQTESEKLVAEREGYDINVVRADMTKTFPFEDESFDVIFHPVSNCYVRDVQHVWNECFRVLKKGGLLLAGVDNGFNYLFSENDESTVTGHLPFDPLADEEQCRMCEAEDCGYQFSHTIGEQIGGQIKAGFTLLDVYDDTNGVGSLHEHGVPTFWATLSKKS